MLKYPNEIEEWNQIHPQDLWVYNKLFLSRILDYNCGPCGVSVSKSDFYIIRPSFNLMGMGREARKRMMFPQTNGFFEDYGMHVSDFWCEIFEGEHLSVDFHHQISELVVLGELDDADTYWKWKKWTKINREIEFPPILKSLVGDYEWINCEFIGNKLIEVHFRCNPDFRWGNNVAVPVWNEDYEKEYLHLKREYIFVEDPDYLRKGFYITFD
jgi:hypothetical protein